MGALWYLIKSPNGPNGHPVGIYIMYDQTMCVDISEQCETK